VIDINIYQYVLFQYIIKLRDNYLHRHKKTWNRLFGVKVIKKQINKLDSYENAIDIINLYNSIALIKIKKLLHIKDKFAFDLLKVLCCTDKNKLLPGSLDYEIIRDMIYNYFNDRLKKHNRCTLCSFVHANVYNDKNVINMNNMYILLTRQQCKNIMLNCCNK